MSGWSGRSGGSGGDRNGTGESGILRKAKVAAPHVVEQHHLDDLLVFGYACKLFRDDDRATQIDQGRHLIPWMGDASLNIDRYDVRATLSDIAPHEAPAGGYTDQLATLTLAEQRAEKLSEEERYYSLYNNDVEEEMYKDETLKRLHRERSSTYGQVAFDYDGVQARATAEGTVAQTATAEATMKANAYPDDDRFVVNPRFYVPPTIEVPDTMKLHAVIEKTAKFVAAQGPQMEILIKAKQSNNPQFEFLNLNNRLNPYYKHVLNAVKNGYYPEPEPEPEPPAADDSVSDGVATPPAAAAIPPPIIVPQIKYKPSADCAYTQLISKIKGVAKPNADGTPSPSDRAAAHDSPEAFSREATLKHIKDFQQFQKNNQTTSAKSDVQKSSASKTNGTLPPNSPAPNKAGAKPATVEVKKISNALMLAQCYNSDTEEDDDDGENAKAKAPSTPTKMPADIPIPPADLQNIIDKTAAYVLKNGKEFEEILRSKNDQRFSFLTYTDRFYRYYVFKVTGAMYSGPAPPVPANVPEPPKEPPKSVSFSIKPKEESASLPLQRPALPQEPSSDEDEDAAASSSNLITPPPLVLMGLLPTPPSTKVLLPTPPTTAYLNTAPPPPPAATTTANGHINRPRPPVTPDPTLLKSCDPNQSESNLRDALLDATSSAKVAGALIGEQRLASASQDQLDTATREKQLQIERRKRAMAFLNQMKTPAAPQSTTTTSNGSAAALSDVVVIDDVVNGSAMATAAGDDSGSVHSVHSVHSSPARSAVIVLNGGVVSDDDSDVNASAASVDSAGSSHRRRRRRRKRSRSTSYMRSRSRSPSTTSSHRRHKAKKSKHHRHHVKKCSKSYRRSRSRSRSRSCSATADRHKSRRSRSRSRANRRSRSVESPRHHRGPSASSASHRSSDAHAKRHKCHRRRDS